MTDPVLDGGVATPEAYDDARREALHVLNVNLIGDANRNRLLRFVHARIEHFKRHLPAGSSQRVRFDLRGQLLSNVRLAAIRQAVVAAAAGQGVQVTVEFLTN